jgi:uncharacterized protein YegL
VNNIIPQLSAMLANQSEVDILPALLRFGGTVDLLNKFAPIEDFQTSTIKARTGSPLGAAVNAMLDEIERAQWFLTRNGVDRILRPVVLLYTDGSPTDEWKAAARRTRDLVEKKELTIIIGAIGNEQFLNKDILSEFTVHPELIFCVEPEKIDIFITITSTLVLSGSRGEVKKIEKTLTDALAEDVGSNNGENKTVVKPVQQNKGKQLKPIEKKQLLENEKAPSHNSREATKQYDPKRDYWE